MRTIRSDRWSLIRWIATIVLIVLYLVAAVEDGLVYASSYLMILGSLEIFRMTLRNRRIDRWLAALSGTTVLVAAATLLTGNDVYVKFQPSLLVSAIVLGIAFNTATGHNVVWSLVRRATNQTCSEHALERVENIVCIYALAFAGIDAFVAVYYDVIQWLATTYLFGPVAALSMIYVVSETVASDCDSQYAEVES